MKGQRMPRQLDFGDPSIRTGFGPDKDKKLKVKDGEGLIVRVASGLKEYLSHKVDNVLPKKPDGTPGVFNMNCAQEWDEKLGDYAGPCLGHDKDYEVDSRYVCGAFVLAIKRGKTIMNLNPADSPKFWDLTAGRVRELKTVVENAYPDVEPNQIGEKLRTLTLLLTLKDEGGSETFQKLNITKWEGEKIQVTDAHKAAYKAEIPALIDEVAAPASIKHQELSLKPRKGAGGAATTKASAPAEDPSDDLALDFEGTEEKKPAPAPARKQAAPAKAAPKKAPEPEPEEAAAEDEDVLNEDEPEEKPAPKREKVGAAKSASKKSSEDAEVEDILSGLEGGD